jgi:hypothetical protein
MTPQQRCDNRNSVVSHWETSSESYTVRETWHVHDHVGYVPNTCPSVILKKSDDLACICSMPSVGVSPQNWRSSRKHFIFQGGDVGDRSAGALVNDPILVRLIFHSHRRWLWTASSIFIVRHFWRKCLCLEFLPSPRLLKTWPWKDGVWFWQLWSCRDALFRISSMTNSFQ